MDQITKKLRVARMKLLVQRLRQTRVHMISLKKNWVLTISSEQQMHMFGTYPKVMNGPSTVQTLLALGTQRALVPQCRLRSKRNRENVEEKATYVRTNHCTWYCIIELLLYLLAQRLTRASFTPEARVRLSFRARHFTLPMQIDGFSHSYPYVNLVYQQSW